jgi:transposase-like protein
MTTASNDPYRGFGFPAEIIQHAVWLYHCFSLSLRDVELILAELASWSVMKAFANGAFALVGCSPLR